MALTRRRDHGKMWNECFNFYFIVIISGLLYLMLLVTSEPVCYTRVSLDKSNRYMKRVDCDGTDKICLRFASREDVNLFDLLDSPCGYPEDHPFTHNPYKVTCSTIDLPTVTDGSFDCDPNTDVSMGEVCTLSCDDGFYAADSDQAVCEAGMTNQEGKWSEGSFLCHAITCSTIDLPTVTDGSFDCDPNTDVSMGEVCSLSCDDGFYVADSDQVVCEAGSTNQSGKWSVGSLNCHVITCQDVHLPTVNDGSFNCSNYSAGSKCNLTCDDGYYPSATKYTLCELYSDQKAKWTVGIFQCSAIACQEVHLPTVKAGFFNCSGYSVGDKCNLTCDNGYYPSSSKEKVCEGYDNHMANWTIGNFQCSEITCLTTNLPFIINGSFDCAANTDVSMGQVCALTCNVGFYAAYSNQVVCEAGTSDQEGKWSGGSFVCHVITCQDDHLPTVNDGSFNCSGHSVGSKCNLTCDAGYYPSATKYTVCEEYDDHKANWTVGELQCSAIKCSTTNLPTVNEGSFDCAYNSDMSMGEACNLRCYNERYPAYSRQAVCVAGTSNQGGVWSNGIFVCQGLECNKWNAWDGSEYKHISTKENWKESRQSCESESSHLVTIQNREENNFVHKILQHCNHDTRYAWIGLNDRNIEGTWEWIDGTVSTYINWDEGQPNGGDTDNCVLMKQENGKWYDFQCSSVYYTVCEKTIL